MPRRKRRKSRRNWPGTELSDKLSTRSGSNYTSVVSSVKVDVIDKKEGVYIMAIQTSSTVSFQ